MISQSVISQRVDVSVYRRTEGLRNRTYNNRCVVSYANRPNDWAQLMLFKVEGRL